MMSVAAGMAAFFVLLSAFLSAGETAVFTIRESRLRTLREEGFRGAERLSQARWDSPGIRSSLFLVILVLNVLAAGAIIGGMALEWGPGAFWAGLPMAAVLVILVSEIIPRSLSGRRPIRFALLSAPLLLRVHELVSALLSPLVHLEDFLDRRNGDEGESPVEREVRELTEIGRREGVVGEEEHLLVERAFRLDELVAWNVMTPRVDIFALKESLALREVIDDLAEVPYSRVPVYGTSVDDITGILYVREAYAHYVSGKGEAPLREIAQAPMFVPGSLSLTGLLKEFQARRTHMGIVADEFGGTDGLVTLEDVLEELVGDIEDETDVSDQPLIRISESEAVVDGGVDLREVNAALNVSLPHLEHRSLNGFILEELGRVPRSGERVETPGLAIEVMDATETQVVRARIRRTQTTGVEGAS